MLVNIDVPELEAGIRFYAALFGLELGRRFGQTAIELIGLEAPIYLLEKPAASLPFEGATAPRTYTRHWTPVHLDFVVPELAPAVARAETLGAVVEGISEHSWGVLALLVDPFGNGLCLIELRGRGYDEIATP
jgi:lactoylglutathione lyase